MVDHAIWKVGRPGSAGVGARPTIGFDIVGVPPIMNEALSLFSAGLRVGRRSVPPLGLLGPADIEKMNSHVELGLK